MSSLHLLKQIRQAITHLNPDEVRKTAGRPLAIGLISAGSAGYEAMEDFLAPTAISRERRLELMQMIHRVGEPGTPAEYDLVFQEEQLARRSHAFPFYGAHPQRSVREVLEVREELGLALARHFPAFRQPVVDRVIHAISKENALFSLATALPNIMPSLVQLPWAVSEFASDSAFLTMNQIRMAFLLAAASDAPVGYREQKAQIASIIASAFGWRAIARELVGKIPLGGGLIPKGAVAYAGTLVVGLSLDRFHRFGYGLTQEEKRETYEWALRQGRNVSALLLAGLKKVDAA